jgi:hypothetical protein
MRPLMTHVMKRLDVDTPLSTVMMTMIALLIHVITLLAALTLPYAAMTTMLQLLTIVSLTVDASTTPPNVSLLTNVRALHLMQSKDVAISKFHVMTIMHAQMIHVMVIQGACIRN